MPEEASAAVARGAVAVAARRWAASAPGTTEARSLVATKATNPTMPTSATPAPTSSLTACACFASRAAALPFLGALVDFDDFDLADFDLDDFDLDDLDDFAFLPFLLVTSGVGSGVGSGVAATTQTNASAAAFYIFKQIVKNRIPPAGQQ